MIIAFCAKAGHGKTTAAKWVCDTYGGEKIAFADPLKRMARKIWGLSDAQMFDLVEKERVDPRYNVTPRYLLQYLGTEVVREELGKETWLNALLNRTRQKPHQLWVIDDLRFENESDAIRNEGGFVVRLVCQDARESVGGNHASEQVGLVPCDATITWKMSESNLIPQLFDLLNERLSK